MGRVIDSSVLVAAERGALNLESLLPVYGDERSVVASITAAELLEGVHRANTEARRIARESLVEALLRVLQVIPFDLSIARAHARLRAQIPRRSQIGAHDLLIGATAVALGYRVVTRDRRSFPRIPGLDVDFV